LCLQGDVEIGRGYGGEVLGDVLLRVRVVAAAELRVDRRGLIGGHAGAAAKGHVLFCVRRAGEAGRGFVAANFEVEFHRHDGRQRIAHDHHLQAVCERGAGDVTGVRGIARERGGGKHEQQSF
jgi:hypothetical protein